MSNITPLNYMYILTSVCIFKSEKIQTKLSLVVSLSGEQECFLLHTFQYQLHFLQLAYMTAINKTTQTWSLSGLTTHLQMR